MTREMVLTRGLPASGKSTWAKKIVSTNPDYTRINRDDFRLMLFNKPVVGTEGEKAVTFAQHGAIEQTLKFSDRSVIVDDTNFFPKAVRDLMKIAQKYDVPVRFEDFTHVSLEECIARDIFRAPATFGKKGGLVGEDVIRSMHKRYLEGRKLPLPIPVLPTYDLKPYTERENRYEIPCQKPWSVIVDIDGTVAKMINKKCPVHGDRHG